ncbi:restriction endonuclease subunit S [Pseudomonas germanica]|uniref:restriction endonuclease subunit S n=1 Tax=Pseudomonas germanica TaxID=2815720 RepID=UPI002A4E2031|nr:restriction endonuclease subunit S [Pseudomonas germanica]WPN75496.1 restriction endonuclease subunit S [Pseudomonas germanica]
MTNLSGAHLNSGAVVGPQGEGRESPSNFSAYPIYKNSGVEWLGLVPEHWALGSLKHLAWIRNGRDHKDVESPDGEYPVIGSGGQFANATRYLYDGESVLLGRKGTIDKPLYIHGRFWTVDTMFYTEISSGASAKFLYYNALTIPFQYYSTSTALPSMTQGDLLNHPCAIPTFNEQTQIARFLDHETARIDALIEEQQRLIELLKEKRHAVIFHAVTKGLDPTVPMKDSGVEWLGELPAHWVVSKFGYISSVVRGGSPRPAGDPELFNGDYSPWVTVAEITKDDEIYLDETETFLTKKGSDQCRVFSKGTLLLSNSGATLGVPKILMIDANANDGVVGFENLSMDKEYSYLYLATLTEGLRGRAAGSGQPNLNTDIVKSIVVPIPPSNEVAEIVAAVKKLRAQFNFLSNEAVEGIRLLQERRSALISAAVTGKIDVRGWQSPCSAPSPKLAKEAV